MEIKKILFIFLLFTAILLPSAAFAYSLGNSNAPVKVVEYSDFQCPWCRKFELYSLPYIYKAFIKKGYVYWSFKDYPLVNIHPFAYKAAEYADCSGKFYMHARYVLYRYQSSWDVTGNIYAFLKSKDFPYIKSIRACVKSGYPVSKIRRDMERGNALGIDSTPTFLIYKNGVYQEKVTGFYGPNYWSNTLSVELAGQ